MGINPFSLTSNYTITKQTAYVLLSLLCDGIKKLLFLEKDFTYKGKTNMFVKKQKGFVTLYKVVSTVLLSLFYKIHFNCRAPYTKRKSSFREHANSYTISNEGQF